MPTHVADLETIDWRSWSDPPPFGGRSRAPNLPLLRIGLHLEQLDPGERSCPLHDHSLEEEQFYVLSGSLTVHERTRDGSRRQFELHAGDLIAVPPDAGVAHGFSNQSRDVVELPDRGELYVRALDSIGTLEPREYDDGEIDP